MAERDARLDELVGEVLQSPKYRSIHPALVRRIGAQELARRRSLLEAIKGTKDRLHQVGGAYLGRRPDYGALLEQVRQASEKQDHASLRQACTRIMRHHASSRERLPILERYYAETLGGLPPIRSVLDLACGLNPFALPWMPLAEGAEYYACDIYQDMVAFIGEFLALVGVRGIAEVCDIAEHCPSRRADVALVLKTIPCLEQLDKAAGERLLDQVDADYILVSFPVHSLGGARKGMVANYEAHFRELVAQRPWAVRRFEFPSELAFVIEKGLRS